MPDADEGLATITNDELVGELVVRRSDSLLIAAQFKSRRALGEFAMKANGPLLHLYGLHRALEAFICQVPIEMRGTGGEHAG